MLIFYFGSTWSLLYHYWLIESKSKRLYLGYLNDYLKKKSPAGVSCEASRFIFSRLFSDLRLDDVVTDDCGRNLLVGCAAASEVRR